MSEHEESAGGRFFALRTFRADGRAVLTPVWLAEDGADTRYLLTPSRSHKVRRLRSDPVVEVAPSDFHGVVDGCWRTGRARVAGRADRSRGLRLLNGKYGRSFRWFRLVLMLGRPRRAGRARGGRAGRSGAGPVSRPKWAEIVGSAVPSAVFVAVTSSAGLVAGLVAGCVAAAALAVLIVRRGGSIGRAIGGFVGIGVAAVIAWSSGDDAGIFLPDIWWSLIACTVLVLSVVLRFPLVGVVWSIALREPFWWRRERFALWPLAWATLAAASVFGARFVVQRWLYDADEIGWLAAAKVAMGLPLTLAALGVVIWVLRRVDRRRSSTVRSEA